MGNQEIRGSSLTDLVMDDIISLIVKQNLQPGSRLPNEYDLAQQFNVGRSTLREAMRRLATRNILEIRQGSGTFVSEKRGVPEDPLGLTFMQHDAKLALDLMDIRLMLEPTIASLSAINATPEQLAHMEELCSEVESRISAGQSYNDEDRALHTYIAECSGNGVLKTLIPIILSSIAVTTASSSDRFRQDTYRQHRCIIETIQRGDTFGASLAMSEHLNTTRRFFAETVKA